MHYFLIYIIEQEQNSMIEFVSEDVIPEIMELFNMNNADVEWIVEEIETRLILQLKSTSSDCNFVFSATLQKSDMNTVNEVIYEAVR